MRPITLKKGTLSKKAREAAALDRPIRHSEEDIKRIFEGSSVTPTLDESTLDKPMMDYRDTPAWELHEQTYGKKSKSDKPIEVSDEVGSW